MAMNQRLLREGFISGARKGWQGFLWVLRILIPISFLTALLGWIGLFNRINFLIQPAMSWLSLPPMAAIPLIIGLVTGIYGGIAAMVVLPFTTGQMTLMAIFMMIAHSLIQEGVIQGKSGFHPAKAILFRLGTAILTVIAVAPFLNSTPELSGPVETSVIISEPFVSMLENWSVSTLNLTIRIFLVMMGILILLEIFKTLGWINPLVRLLSPVLKLLGLSQRVGVLWFTGAVFGLIYGAAVIFEEVKQGNLTKEELEELHLSIGIHHSVIEDPAIFMTMGMSAFWLWVPRLIVVILVVRLLSLWHLIRKTRFQ